VDYPQNAEDKLMCYSQEALEPETIRGQAWLLICRQALIQANVLQALVSIEYIYRAPILSL